MEDLDLSKVCQHHLSLSIPTQSSPSYIFPLSPPPGTAPDSTPSETSPWERRQWASDGPVELALYPAPVRPMRERNVRAICFFAVGVGDAAELPWADLAAAKGGQALPAWRSDVHPRTVGTQPIRFQRGEENAMDSSPETEGGSMKGEVSKYKRQTQLAW